jgi:hypothetical protein
VKNHFTLTTKQGNWSIVYYKTIYNQTHPIYSLDTEIPSFNIVIIHYSVNLCTNDGWPFILIQGNDAIYDRINSKFPFVEK